MFGAYIRFKCNYVAFRKSSDNQKQHLFIGQRRIIGNNVNVTVIIHHIEGHWNCAIRIYQDTTKKTMTCNF